MDGHQTEPTEVTSTTQPHRIASTGRKRSYAEFSALHTTKINVIVTPPMLVIREGEDYFFEDDAQLPYKLIKNLGHGHSATVEKVEDVNTGSVFARKVFPICGSRSERKNIFNNEIKIIRRLTPHHHVIRIFATYVAKREVGLILHPVADGGDLGIFLQDFKDPKAAQPVQLGRTKILESSFGCLASGLAFMHRQKIRHKDIKPQNILVHKGSMIYTDFGYSLDHSAIGRSTTTGVPHAFTRKYCAPEVSDYGPRNSKSDIFSLGCVFLEILFVLYEELVPPNPGKSYHDYLENSQLRSSLEDLNHLGMITSDMLHPRPEDRSSAEVVTSHLRHYEADRFCAKCKADMQHPRRGFAAFNPSTLGSASYTIGVPSPSPDANGNVPSHSAGDAPLPSPRYVPELDKDPLILERQDQVKVTSVQSEAATSDSRLSNLLGSANLWQSGTAYRAPDLRRLSVQSLLTGPLGDNPQAFNAEGQHSRQYPIGDAGSTIYGYDMGYPDLDTPKNDDLNAIAIFSSPSGTIGFNDDSTYGNAEMRGKDMAFERGGYYAKSVPIKISKSLEPLPTILLENPMNLLYFHHFVNHTARILVPHDCEQNPFRQILPEMAIHDENIMNLLAFSASHRARLLNHPEPSNRIAVCVTDVFPKLRRALDSNPSQISVSALAPAIMMASLEIVSPNTFEVPISWQNSLTIARQMIIARGGPRSVDRHDRVMYFLARWFGYMDVLGSLSGNKNDQPLSSYWSSENASADEDFQIDCLTGFTNRCVGILARIAELAKQCEPARIDEEGNIHEDWRPEPEIVRQAAQIQRDLEEGLSDHIVHMGCNHRSSNSSVNEAAWDATEIYATNEMFHWAGLIHLFRRVLGKPAMDPEVQNAVREIVGLLYKVRRGSTAAACLLFPMFAAGCDAMDEGQRERIMEMLRSVEGFGMAQIHKARSLVQRVWDTGKPWESLVSGEFFG